MSVCEKQAAPERLVRGQIHVLTAFRCVSVLSLKEHRVLAGYLEPASLPSSSELAGRRSKVALAGQQVGTWRRKPTFPKVDQVPWILSVWPSRVVLQLETGLAEQKPICGPHPPPQTLSSRTYCPHWGRDDRPADSSVCLDVQVMFLMGINMWSVVFMLCADSQRTIYSPLSRLCLWPPSFASARLIADQWNPLSLLIIFFTNDSGTIGITMQN